MNDVIRDIIQGNNKADKINLYGFREQDSIGMIRKKFNYFVVGNYPRYYKNKSADFHRDMIENTIKSYLGRQDFLNIGFRGCGKTSITKLFIVFALLNDRRETKRHYIKIQTRDISSSTQRVTDIYNLLTEVKGLYGNMFEVKTSDFKKEETVKSLH